MPRLDYIYVSIQLLLFLAFFLLPRHWSWPPENWVAYIGLFLFLIGSILGLLSLRQLGHSLTPYPSPKINATLKTQGLYSWVRHPIYTSLLFAFLGLSLYLNSYEHGMVVLGLYLLFLLKSNYEERLLVKKYGIAYENYQRKTGRFLPKLRNPKA